MTSGEILANSIRGILRAHNDDEKSVRMLIDDLCRNYEESKQRELELMAWMGDALNTLQAFSKTFEEYDGVMPIMFGEADELSRRANQLRQQADKQSE